MEDSDSGSESDGEGTKKPSGIEFDKINFEQIFFKLKEKSEQYDHISEKHETLTTESK